MDKEFIRELERYIRVRLTEKRYRHTEGVIATSVELAKRYGADEEKTYIAALFHDACKNLDSDEMNMLVEEYEIGDIYIDKPQLAHSKLAAKILEDRFGVTDEDILNAVSFHTTGRENMSLLEKIIFVADAVEPNRTYPEAEELNRLAFQDLDQAGYEIADRSIKRVKNQGMFLDEDTVKARDWFAGLLQDNSLENSRNFAVYAANVIDGKKGSDIVVIDVAEKSSFADYLVIATGGTIRQTDAIADYIEERAEMQKRFTRRIEGKNGSGWTLMDYGDVIINLFVPEMREKYDLETIWSDCDTIDWEA